VSLLLVFAPIKLSGWIDLEQAICKICDWTPNDVKEQ
jgi:hypothetical protein